MLVPALVYFKQANVHNLQPRSMHLSCVTSNHAQDTTHVGGGPDI